MDKKQAVYESLRFRIIKNDLRPGEVLNEKRLMAHYKIGRTPLREILLHLQRDRLIQTIPRQGTLVAAMEFRELREIVEVRTALETLVARLSVRNIRPDGIRRIRELLETIRGVEAERPPDTLERLTRLDLAFHDALYDAAGNRRLKDILLDLQREMARFWFQMGLGESDLLGQLRELDDIVQGLEDGDAERVRAALDAHIRLYVTNIREEIL